MNAEIIAVGSELLLGQIANTNAQFLSKELACAGVNVYYHSVVGDNPIRLTEVISSAKKRSNLIIFTGGLGPTKDDLTKETVAASVARSLVIDDNALQTIETYHKQRNRIMTENNRKQAVVIDGSFVLPNDHGLAPGMAFKENNVYYLLLPGPPNEMKPMFLKYGLPYLFQQQKKTTKISSRVLNFFDIGESQLETELLDLIESQTNPTIAPLAKEGEVTIRLTVKHDQQEDEKRLLDEVEEKILRRVGQFFYGYDDTSLLNEVTKLFKEQKVTIAAAESLTGGRFASEITTISGSSHYFKGGITCYSNEAKEAILGVSHDLLSQFGAVSEQCAKALADYVRKMLRTTVGISFTGVAGPTEIEGKAVGTVFIGVSMEGQETVSYQLQLAGTREQIQNRSVKYGLYSLLKLFSKGGIIK